MEPEPVLLAMMTDIRSTDHGADQGSTMALHRQSLVLLVDNAMRISHGNR